ncbi:hypothetical protein DIPPA_02834 [Diplonema papillatum]|nr:hypothetical protein DIPPA_02834 [Diplonema papillatum]
MVATDVQCVELESSVDKRLQQGLSEAKKLFDTARSFEPAGDVRHTYTDKFLLAEHLTRSCVLAQLQILRELGVTSGTLRQLQTWHCEKQAVTLRFSSHERCFLEQHTIRREAVSTHNIPFFKTFTKKLIEVDEYHWTFSMRYELFAYRGSDVTKKVSLLTRQSAISKLVTATEGHPYPQEKTYEPIDFELEWLFKNIKVLDTDDDATEDDSPCHVLFAVDRSQQSCRTPRRNEQVQQAVHHFSAFSTWCRSIRSYLLHLNEASDRKNEGVCLHQDDAIIASPPFLPVLEEMSPTAILRASDISEGINIGPQGLLLSESDLRCFLSSHDRFLKEACNSVSGLYPPVTSGQLISEREAKLCLLTTHACNVVTDFVCYVDYLEALLRRQLVAAVGRWISQPDFEMFMRFRARKLFKFKYIPKPFCYAARHEQQHPEGLISIVDAGEPAQPILTMCRTVQAAQLSKRGFRFDIHAAATASLKPEVHLHIHTAFRFAHDVPLPELALTASARQYAGFALLLGTIGGPDLFLPECAMLVQNRDEFHIPLVRKDMMAAEGAERILASLSPEQQRFARAYRQMQKDNSLFAVCIVHIKPQLENALNLPPSALSKEVKLTQDVLELLQTYGVSVDLLRFRPDSPDDEGQLSAENKVSVVANTVKKVQTVVRSIEEQRVQEAKLRSAVDHRDPTERTTSLLPELPEDVKKAAAGVSQTAEKSGEAEGPTGSLFSQSNVDVSKFSSAVETAVHNMQDTRPFGAVNPVLVRAGDTWVLNSTSGKLLAPPSTILLSTEKQLNHKLQTMSLLDSLTRTGTLPLVDTVLHIIASNVSAFDKDLMDTLTQDNVNPIDQAELSLIAAACALYGQPPGHYLNSEAAHEENDSSEVAAACKA